MTTHNRVGKYHLLAELGRGGMATVYLALVHGPAGWNKLVVLKEIQTQLVDDPDFIGMFLDEARLAARLSHRNVVQTNEVGNEEGRLFIAMEYLDGQPYNQVKRRLGPDRSRLTLGMQIRILIEVLAGLHHAHDLLDFDGTPLYVVHRDATPHNVFVTYDGQVKVVDFGIAKAATSQGATRTGMLKGKVPYMAPEQAAGDRVDRRADIFSVGVMLWEAATGTRLFKGLGDIQILNRLLTEEAASPRTIDPGIDPRLEAICMKALARDRNRRYTTAAELQGVLEQYLLEIDDRSTIRDVGNLMAVAFAEERAKIKAVVEQQAKEAKSMSQSGSLPVLDMQATTGSNVSLAGLERSGGAGSNAAFAAFQTSGASAALGALSGTNAKLADLQQTSGSSPSLEVPSPAPTGSPVVAGHSEAPGRSVTATHLPVPFQPPPAPRSRLLFAGLAGVALLAGGALAVRAFAPPAPPRAASAEPAPRAPVALTIQSTPAGATISEGGRVLGITPQVVPLDPAATEARNFVLTLEGHAPQPLRQTPATSDVTVIVPLTAAAAPTSVAPSSAPSTVSSAPGTGPRPASRPPAAIPTATPTGTARATATSSPLDIRLNR